MEGRGAADGYQRTNATEQAKFCCHISELDRHSSDQYYFPFLKAQMKTISPSSSFICHSALHLVSIFANGSNVSLLISCALSETHLHNEVHYLPLFIEHLLKNQNFTIKYLLLIIICVFLLIMLKHNSECRINYKSN